MSGPYSRVYWSIRSDPKFVDIWHDTMLVGVWVKLLITADAHWPEPADVPSWCRIKDFRKLVSVGILDDLGRGQFRIHGLDAERMRRSSHAQTASNARWNAPSIPESNPPSNAQTILGKAEAKQSLEETEASSAREGGIVDPADDYWTLTGRYPTGKVVSWIDDLIGEYGAEQVSRSLVRAHREDSDVSTLLGRTKNYLAADARAITLRERQDEQTRLREKRSIPVVRPTWDEGERNALWERYRDDIARAAGRRSA